MKFGKTTRSAGDNEAVGTTEVDHKIIKRVEEISERKGWTMTQVVLAWENKRVTSPAIGFSSEKRMDEALAARGKVLSQEEEQYLEELYVPRPIEGHA